MPCFSTLVVFTTWFLSLYSCFSVKERLFIELDKVPPCFGKSMEVHREPSFNSLFQVLIAFASPRCSIPQFTCLCIFRKTASSSFDSSHLVSPVVQTTMYPQYTTDCLHTSIEATVTALPLAGDQTDTAQCVHQ